MQTLKTLYNLLQINHKIEDLHVRMLYLKDIWGMEQTLIGELEGFSQSYISKELIIARQKVLKDTFIQQTSNLYTAQEVQYVQMLPRSIIGDMQVLAFIENVLGVTPIHPFFNHYDTPMNIRIAALASLGIQNKCLMVMFDKSQPNISMMVKRYSQKTIETQRDNRYDKIPEYKLKEKSQLFNFIKAGGQ